jgi:hypothetical protein
VLYPLLVIILGIMLFQNADAFLSIAPIEVLKIFSPVLIFIALMLIMYFVITPMLYKKHYDANKSLRLPQVITIDENAITTTSDSSSTTLTKKNIVKIKYGKNAIYVYMGLNMAHIFPKSFLENENDFDDLTAFMKTYYR